MTAFARARALVAVLMLVLAGAILASPSTASATSGAVEKSAKLVRSHLVDGTDQVADTRNVSISVSQTTDLRDRQEITVTWKGAHPTGGLVVDPNSGPAAQEEYPVVIMQCRGVDSTTAAADKQVRPQTCWTQTPDERFQYSPSGFSYPPYRMDRYATTDQRQFVTDEPANLPDACSYVDAAHWVPFIAADGTVYPGGPHGCAGMAPEAALSTDSLQPSNTTYAVTDTDGRGTTKFVVNTADSNASMGCSATVACTLEVIPIMGISCDATGTATGTDLGMPVSDRPVGADVIQRTQDMCDATGHFPAGVFNGGSETADQAVTGALWWSASNWRDRISFPMTFAPSASACDVVTRASTAYLYGSETLLQATQQWAPKFCLDPKLFTVRHVQTSETQAKNLLNVGNVEAAVQAGPPDTPFTRKVVQAPTAVTGFAVAYSADDAAGNPVANLVLNARLLAKLLSESYRSCATCLDFTSDDAVKTGFAKLATNPIDMSRDPEFQALNPGIPKTLNLEAGAALATVSSDSDVISALTSYINADPEARAWLDGKPDPWGMVVNPAYKGISLPVTNWPLRDTHIATFTSGANQCLSLSPVPWLPLVAAPVSSPAAVALNMQFDIANAQVQCKNNGDITRKLTAVGRESPGGRFLFGVVSLADARRYQLDVAGLQTHSTASTTAAYTSRAGRTFVTPDDAGLEAAAKLLVPDKDLQTWVVPYGSMRTSTAGASAYPGTLLVSTDVPTEGLSKTDAQNYATLLRFISGAGQQPGVGVGELPPGYLALTSANGLGELVDYTNRAAEAVAAQKGAVWPLTATPTQPTSTATSPIAPTSPTRPTSSSPRPTGGNVSSTPVVGPGASTQPGGGIITQPTSSTSTPKASKSPSTSASPQPSSSTSPAPSQSVSPEAENVAHTTAIKSGALGLALPVVALIALVGFGIAAWFSGVGRR